MNEKSVTGYFNEKINCFNVSTELQVCLLPQYNITYCQARKEC